MTYDTIKAPSAWPRPCGIGRLPESSSCKGAGPDGCARALVTASLNLRLNVSMYEMS